MTRGDRRRRSSNRRATEQGDSVFQALLTQITVCGVLLLLAYALKASGQPYYEQMRSYVDQMGATSWTIQDLWAMLPMTGQSADALTQLEENIQRYGGGRQEEDQQDGLLPDAQQSTSGSGSSADDAAGEELPDVGDLTQADDTVILPDTRLVTQEDTELLSSLGTMEELDGQGGLFQTMPEQISAPSGMLLSPVYATDKPILPVQTGRLTCGYGYRIHPITGELDFHTGVDIASGQGSKIFAVYPGTVQEVGESSIYGNYIIIKSGKIETMYAHCSEVLAPDGANIRKGEVIARVGSTGISTGPHVHLEFWQDGMRFDPAFLYDEF